MENESLKRPSHKEWRRLVKKKRRQRLRQKAARELEEEAERLQQILEKQEDYLENQEKLKKLEEEREKQAQEEHDKLEKAWLEAEVRELFGSDVTMSTSSVMRDSSLQLYMRFFIFIVHNTYKTFRFRKKLKKSGKYCKRRRLRPARSN